MNGQGEADLHRNTRAEQKRANRSLAVVMSLHSCPCGPASLLPSSLPPHALFIHFLGPAQPLRRTASARRRDVCFSSVASLLARALLRALRVRSVENAVCPAKAGKVIGEIRAGSGAVFQRPESAALSSSPTHPGIAAFGVFQQSLHLRSIDIGACPRRSPRRQVLEASHAGGMATGNNASSPNRKHRADGDPGRRALPRSPAAGDRAWESGVWSSVPQLRTEHAVCSTKGMRASSLMYLVAHDCTSDTCAPTSFSAARSNCIVRLVNSHRSHPLHYTAKSNMSAPKLTRASFAEPGRAAENDFKG